MTTRTVTQKDLERILNELQTVRSVVDVASVATLPDNVVDVSPASLCALLQDVWRRLGTVEDGLSMILEPSAEGGSRE